VKKVYIETYGCALNKGDTYIMKTVLARKGYSIVDNPVASDVIIINTCTVRMETQQRMIHRIKTLYELAIERDKKLIIAGCLAKAQPYLVSKIAPNASLLSPQNVSKIDIVVRESSKVILLDGDRDRNTIGVWLEDRIGIIPIQEGCLGNCSFCIVKNARRKLFSYPIEHIAETVRELIKKGAVEIQLSGQDTATYGIDLYGKPMLPKLIQRIIEVPGNYMIRIGMLNPDTVEPIVDDLIEAMREHHVYKFLHIPLQSGSDKVLKIMRRKYTVDQFRHIIKELRSKLSNIAIATDIIIGHPGEDEEDFEDTLRIIKELEFDRIHVAQYTIRPNTYSASLKQVNSKIKKKRMKRFLELMENIGLKKHSKYLGKVVKAFVTERGRNTYIARLINYTPVVINSNKEIVGKWINARIHKITFFDLRGDVIG